MTVLFVGTDDNCFFLAELKAKLDKLEQEMKKELNKVFMILSAL